MYMVNVSELSNQGYLETLSLHNCPNVTLLGLMDVELAKMHQITIKSCNALSDEVFS